MLDTGGRPVVQVGDAAPVAPHWFVASTGYGRSCGFGGAGSNLSLAAAQIKASAAEGFTLVEVSIENKETGAMRTPWRRSSSEPTTSHRQNRRGLTSWHFTRAEN